jgi:eukaryotic-like serine/threonine-protein kinase
LVIAGVKPYNKEPVGTVAMTPELFRQIEELYHAAREGTAEERAALLAQTNPELRREVELLLSQQTSGEFLDRPAIQNAPELLEDSTIAGLAAGACLGPYRIESKLGEGGMGEVFRAVDTRLGRAVAIKTMREQFSARFEREARAISSVNHPHICALYDVGPNYLVMELVAGETIAARLKSGPFPMKTALLYGSQIAAALAEAHGKGIIHRDLKPRNIMIAKSGVKVLDFGLAKAGTDDTVTASRMVIGTPAYMAPEQREGKPADARTDIYSFGCLLYEMLTGGRVGAPQRRIPSRKLEKIVNRCLEEDPACRWQSAADLERELGKLTAGTSPWKAVSAAAGILALFAAAYPYLHRAPRLTDKDTILLADFDNKTGDPVFDDTLRQGLSVELQQSPFLTLISDGKVQQELALMGQPKQARLTPEIAQQVCERTASAAVLEGSIARVGSQYVLGLRAKNCNNGNILYQEQAVAAKREDVLNSISQIVRKFRIRVGESLATVERHSTPLAEATTSSLEALKAYSTGMKAVVPSGNEAAIPFFQRAVEIDPTFAMAYANLGLSYSAIGDSVLSAESTTKAWQLRDRVSDREKFFIDFTYDRQVTGNLEKAYQTLELWSQTYPRVESLSPQSLLGGLSTHGTGRFEIAIKAAKELIAADPDFVMAYSGLASSYFVSDRFPEAESALQRASERKLENSSSLVLRYNIAVLKGDREQMDRAVRLAKGKRRAEHLMAHEEALALARSGRLEAARRSSSRAVDLALQEREREQAASYRAARAVWEAACGNAAEGKRSAMAALELSKGRDVQYAAGVALALSGDFSRSEALGDDLDKRFPEDTFVKFTYAPVLRGLASLGRGKPADAVERLEIALRYELASNGLNFNFYLGGLHSAYVRGEALTAAHRYGDAAAEFQKILDHRGVVGVDPIGALAHLQLGRALVLSGDKAKAKAAYGDFLTLWKDADSDLQILKQAKAEYARLQ